MRYRDIIEGEVVSFPRKRKNWRHLIEILHFPGRSHPWVVFLHGIHFNGFRTEAEAVKFSDKAEKEWDRQYVESDTRTRIINIGKDWILLDRGVYVETFATAGAAYKKAEQIEPNSKTNHWIDIA